MMFRALVVFLLAHRIAAAQAVPPPPPPPPPGFVAAAPRVLEPGEAARIEGVVRDKNGEPIARAQLRLLPNSNGGPVAVLPQIITAASGEDGSFALENIAPGLNYRINVQRQGYVNTIYGARRSTSNGIPISLARGQVVQGVVIEMTEHAVMAGTITDVYGDPVPNAQVMLMRQGWTDGKPRLFSTNAMAANDLGEFRIAGIAPGTYYLRVQQRAQPGGPATGSGVEGNVPTFFPNSTEERSARALTVASGDELLGINIQLQQGRTFTIAGKLVDAAGNPVSGVPVIALPNGEALGGILLQPSRPDGSFNVQASQPGKYVVQGLPLSRPDGPVLVRPVTVTVVDKDILDLVLEAEPGIVLRGSLQLEGSDIQSLLANAKPSVSLRFPGPINFTRNSQVQPDGAFEVNGVPGGAPILEVTGLPENIYIKSLKLGGEEVTLANMEISGPTTLEILVSPKAAGVVGVTSGEPGTQVTFWPVEPQKGQTNDGFRSAITDQNRAYSFQRLPPGTYYLAAWEDAEPGLLISRDFLAKFAAAAMKVEIAEGVHLALEAPVISAEAYAVEEAKLQ